MSRIITILFAFSLAFLSGCGGSGSSGKDDVVSDGRSVVLRIDQTVALGDNTYFAVRQFQDGRTPDDAANIMAPIITLTGFLSRKNSPYASEQVTIRYQKDEYIKSNTTGLTYRFQWDAISPPRGLDRNRINQEDFRLTFRITKVP